MKSKFNIKQKTGTVTPESADDLYILNNILKVGDIVKGKTTRSVELQRGEQKVKVGRKTVTLSIVAEKIELTDKLRVNGKIVDGPEDVEHAHHSLDIKIGSTITIIKHWKVWEINKIKEASIKPEPVTIVILDEWEADIYQVTDRKKHIANIRSPGLGKQTGESKKPEYYKKIISDLKKREGKIIIAGPGFAKEEIVALLKENKITAIMDSVSHNGEVGLRELFKRGTLEKIRINSRISEETQIVEKLFTEIAKEGLSTYGLEETKIALESGAVETLLVSDKKIREVEELLDKAEKMKTNIMIISSDHDAGEKLFGLGGIASLLRYRI